MVVLTDLSQHFYHLQVITQDQLQQQWKGIKDTLSKLS